MKGPPPIFVKPLVLPASFSRSTLSNELLNALKQCRPNSLSPGQPSQTSVSQPAAANPPSGPASAVPSSVLENLLASFDQKPSAPTAESKDGVSDTTAAPVPTSTPADHQADQQPSCGGGVDSQLDRPPSNFDDCGPLHGSREPDKNPDPTTTPVMASFMVPPAETPNTSEQTPSPADVLRTALPPNPCSTAPETPAVTPPSAPGPLPGATLLSIQPLNLPSKFNQELYKILSDSVQSGSSQVSTQNPPSVPCTLPPGLALPPPPPHPSPPADISPLVPCPDTVSRPSPPVPVSPSQQARQLLNHLLLNSPSTVQKLKSLVGCYPTPTTNPISAPADSPPCPPRRPSATDPCSLNLAFIKYLSTIPRCLNRQ